MSNAAVTRARRTTKKDWRPRFLEALGETGTVSEAVKVVGIGRATAYDERQRNEDFALAWADVIEASTEELEREAVRRAKNGSDVLLIFMLKSRRPDVYRDNVRLEHSGRVDSRTQVELPGDSEERSLEAAKILERARAELQVPEGGSAPNGNGNGHH